MLSLAAWTQLAGPGCSEVVDVERFGILTGGAALPLEVGAASLPGVAAVVESHRPRERGWQWVGCFCQKRPH